MTERLVTCVDPGNCLGVATGFDGVLVHCYASTPDGVLDTGGYSCGPGEYVCVFELPRFYGTKKYKSDHVATGVANSLIRESVTLGEWKRQARQLGARTVEISPRDWKGTIKKAAMVQRVLARLTPAERALFDALALPKSKAHNVADAIGMFLKMTGRLERSFGTRPAALTSQTRPGRVRRVTRKAI